MIRTARIADSAQIPNEKNQLREQLLPIQLVPLEFEHCYSISFSIVIRQQISIGNWVLPRLLSILMEIGIPD